jgi:hypothetical protein
MKDEEARGQIFMGVLPKPFFCHVERSRDISYN